MFQTKIIIEYNLQDLEDRINDWLAEEDPEVIDLKLTPGNEDGYGNPYHFVLILYKE